MTFKHAVSWFEIPVDDLDRAQKLYEAIFDAGLIPMTVPDFEMRMFPIIDPMNVCGTLAKRS
ncbi:hypothetical protein [Hufsiella ginkgonis]|uniref:VOC family protein n=1 Tax=Hufsiella ginkgonis TaxID=2695274 RepID=A0A7K1Y0L7_9SPHI|nr:hypothetical protein [Hufsiella ginkgonis]MXV16780.1 hypothetical protein [Hufsiella ginkgonis]